MDLKSSKGIGVLDVVIAAAALIFIVLPVFSAVAEKFIMLNTAQLIKDSVDITNLAAYNSINSKSLSKAAVTFDSDEARTIYALLLAKNLRLAEDLTPEEGSVAAGKVDIDSLVLYEGELPPACPSGTRIEMPAVHSVITVPVKPALYRRMILEVLGRETVDLKIHVDTEIPLNR